MDHFCRQSCCTYNCCKKWTASCLPMAPVFYEERGRESKYRKPDRKERKEKEKRKAKKATARGKNGPGPEQANVTSIWLAMHTLGSTSRMCEYESFCRVSIFILFLLFFSRPWQDRPPTRAIARKSTGEQQRQSHCRWMDQTSPSHSSSSARLHTPIRRRGRIFTRTFVLLVTKVPSDKKQKYIFTPPCLGGKWPIDERDTTALLLASP